MLHDVEQFFDSDLPIYKVVFVPAGLIPRIVLQGLQNAFFLIQRHWIWMPLEIVVAGILTFITFFNNLLRSSSDRAPSNRVCSSLALVMQNAMGRSVKAHDIEEPLVQQSRRVGAWLRRSNRAESSKRR